MSVIASEAQSGITSALAQKKAVELSVEPRYSDNEYEYRHVQLPKNMLKAIPKEYFDPSKGTLKLLWEEEWRGLGITQASNTAAYLVNEGLLADTPVRVELGLGALRGARARTTHTSFQVRFDICV